MRLISFVQALQPPPRNLITIPKKAFQISLRLAIWLEQSEISIHRLFHFRFSLRLLTRKSQHQVFYLGGFRSASRWDVQRAKAFDPARTCDKHVSAALSRLLLHSFFFPLAAVYLTQWHPGSPTRTPRVVLSGLSAGRSLCLGNKVPPPQGSIPGLSSAVWVRARLTDTRPSRRPTRAPAELSLLWFIYVFPVWLAGFLI